MTFFFGLQLKLGWRFFVKLKPPLKIYGSATAQQKLVLLKLEEFTLELSGNNVSPGQECFF